MTVKKTLSLKRPAPAAASADATPAAAAPGGATIADRFKLDAPSEKKASSAAGVGTKVAVVAAVVALAVVGLLTYTLYGHWEFLKGA